MHFNTIPGLNEVKEHLISTVTKNKVAHAQLFAGPEGSPNLAMAIAFANYLACLKRTSTGSCGECPACNKSFNFIHPDIQFIFPVTGTKSIPSKDALSNVFLKEWRSFIKENPYGTLEDWTMAFGGQDKQAIIPVNESREIIKSLSLKSFESEYKIVIIWLPERMGKAAASALLKVLEEPPGKTVFLLVTDNAGQLLSTITSRTQRLNIRKFTYEEMCITLMDTYEVSEEKAQRISRIADGNLHEAQNIILEIEDNTHEWFREWMRVCFTVAYPRMVELSEEFAGMNKVVRKSMLAYSIGMMRETLITGTVPDLSHVNGEDQAFALNFSKVMDEEKIDNLFKVMGATMYHLERNANAKIEFLNLSLSISEIFKSTKI